MEYKLIACDLDGTLLDRDSHLSGKNAEAIANIRRAGVEFVVCTGRTFYEIPEDVLNCRDIRYIIYSDGAAAVDRKRNEQIFTRYINAETAKAVFAELSRYDAMIEIYENCRPVTDIRKISKESYRYYRIDESYHPTMDRTRVGVGDLKEYLDTHHRVEIFNAFFRFPQEREECLDRLNNIKGINFTTSMENNIEIMSFDASKGEALKELCAVTGIKTENAVCMGDSKNDLSMYAAAGTALAPANADETVKRAASAVICRNTEGVADYVYKNYIKK